MAVVPVGSTAPDQELDGGELGDDDNDSHGYEQGQWAMCQSCQQFLIVILMIDGDGDW